LVDPQQHYHCKIRLLEFVTEKLILQDFVLAKTGFKLCSFFSDIPTEIKSLITWSKVIIYKMAVTQLLKKCPTFNLT
jgi:hypothetical protein